MKFSELYRLLERNGWYIQRTGKHHIYAHPDKPHKLTVGKHGREEVATGTLISVLKSAGLK